MKRFGSASWNGGLREGNASLSTESRALNDYTYTFFNRYGERPGTNGALLVPTLAVIGAIAAHTRSSSSVARRPMRPRGRPRLRETAHRRRDVRVSV
jgi:hypothetical protein